LLVQGAGIFSSPSGIGTVAAGASVAFNLISVAGSLPAFAGGVGAPNAGGANVVRSIGHTQFLAMSLTLQVPNIPSDYKNLCAGMQWLNLQRNCEDCSKFEKIKTAATVAAIGIACIFGLHCGARMSILAWSRLKNRHIDVPR
jgi:hypothetical protein